MEVTRLFKSSIVTKSIGVSPKFTRSHRFFSTANGNVLVIADHDNSKLSNSVLNTITAAKQLGKNITVLVAGDFKGTTGTYSLLIYRKPICCQTNRQDRWRF
jgi:hypothetical protein